MLLPKIINAQQFRRSSATIQDLRRFKRKNAFVGDVNPGTQEALFVNQSRLTNFGKRGTFVVKNTRASNYTCNTRKYSIRSRKIALTGTQIRSDDRNVFAKHSAHHNEKEGLPGLFARIKSLSPLYIFRQLCQSIPQFITSTSPCATHSFTSAASSVCTMCG